MRGPDRQKRSSVATQRSEVAAIDRSFPTSKKKGNPMLCNAPTVAYRRCGINKKTGKHFRPFKFFPFDRPFDPDDREYKISRAISDYKSCPLDAEPILVPCRRCLLCTKNYRRQWAYRLTNEARTSGDSMYLTLTVDDEHINDVFPPLVPGGWNSLRQEPWQLFAKRLRIALQRGIVYFAKKPVYYKGDLVPDYLAGVDPCEKRVYKRDSIKFYMCGEYGDETHRPHYHACIFGARFPDLIPAKRVKGKLYYTSPTLLKLWPYGQMSLVSDVTPHSASYVCGYVDKKLNCDRTVYDVNHVNPEYVRMSNGLGEDFFDLYYDELYCKDGSEHHLIDGRFHVQAPAYYDKKLWLRDPERFDIIFDARECRRLQGIAQMDVRSVLNESGRRHAVAVARRQCREIRELP